MRTPQMANKMQTELGKASLRVSTIRIFFLPVISPARTSATPFRIASVRDDLEMKPDAPSSMERRTVAASSVPDTTMTGTAGCAARTDTSADRPLRWISRRRR